MSRTNTTDLPTSNLLRPTRPHRGDNLARAPVPSCTRKLQGGEGGASMTRLTREHGQTLAGYTLMLAPATIVVAFVLAVIALTG